MQSNDKIAELIFQLSRLLREEMIFSCFAARLSMLQLHTLLYIKKNEVVQMGDIAAQFHIELPTATSLLNKLVSLQLVKRQTTKTDRRLVQIVITPRGKEVLLEAWEQRNKKIALMLSFLSEQDKAALETILNKLTRNLAKRYEK